MILKYVCCDIALNSLLGLIIRNGAEKVKIRSTFGGLLKCLRLPINFYGNIFVCG